MFVAHQAFLGIEFDTARARLVNLIRDGSLTSVSEDAYATGATGLVRVGPAASVPVMSKLVAVHLQEPVTRGRSAMVPLRWEAIGPGGALFPVLDADITIAAAGAQSTMARLDGSYRPPLGMLGSGLDSLLLHRIAAATTRRFLRRVADVIAAPSGPVMDMTEPVAGDMPAAEIS